MIYQGFKIVFATMHPAYCSYKAVKTKNVKEYVKWMMYWIVYAFFLTAETFADIFVSWIPFYCEVKIVFLLWMLSPTTKGSSILYRKILHPQLSKREQEIDSCIDKASLQGYSSLRHLVSRTISLTADVVLASAVVGQAKLSDHLSKTRSSDSISAGLDSTDDVRRDAILRNSTGSSSDNDDVMNAIIEESYRQEMKEKPIKT